MLFIMCDRHQILQQILTTLRAIGNTGQARAVNVISRCLNYRKPIEVRVAAAEAFRRMPCDADVSSQQNRVQ